MLGPILQEFGWSLEGLQVRLDSGHTIVTDSQPTAAAVRRFSAAYSWSISRIDGESAGIWRHHTVHERFGRRRRCARGIRQRSGRLTGSSS